ncbi:MAG: hypothetical protein IPM38_00050 [Ignavibacteria bacterium]|nr:hypothetical protein [Ignavibacteria bacterium]
MKKVFYDSINSIIASSELKNLNVRLPVRKSIVVIKVESLNVTNVSSCKVLGAVMKVSFIPSNFISSPKTLYSSIHRR